MNALFHVGPKGGEVHFCDEDGQIRRTVSLVCGTYATASFQKLRRAGEVVSFPGLMSPLSAKSARMRHPGHLDSAANPSFRVSPAQRQAKQLQALMARSEALNRRAQKALQAVKRSKRDVPMIEHTPDVSAASDAGEVSAT